ncbi:oxygen-independent coproporphyrinogen-3 oxidase [Saccharicrinis carchari]|uniref:Heme chaperone HemW n=1 Tax=Saccharicrinis carchari TaxID=1168039 RepID=A0A521CGK4_SACCC|nr:radical SAM family heme chaperone HemW [Saccharicrinis carchari]SMO58576.1 oxygen-independent coproporphyrinogen-3 oxidase [Saccharicrinis carchari]
MAGIYIHIPFCMQKCGYCDFYSLVGLSDKKEFVVALCDEIRIRKEELQREPIQTVYFGGGTPSVLHIKDFENIIASLKEVCDIAELLEFTIEVNPDDINLPFLDDLKRIGFNRLSIGIQSFNDRILSFMNRRHSSSEAFNAVEMSKKAGFENISIDLIYGIPDMTLAEWKKSIDKAISLKVQHISAYHLTFEPGTAFYKKLKQNIFREVEDKQSIEQYNVLIKAVTKAGFDDYEISNFCLPGYQSKHNASYWSGYSYVGLGPSAHSFAARTRRWNISDLKKYINNIKRGEVFYEQEILSDIDVYNEKIMLGLRTKNGAEIRDLHSMDKKMVQLFNEKMQKNIMLKNVFTQNGRLKVCKDKKILTDQIISDFFVV